MKVLTGGNLRFKKMIQDSIKRIKQFGYEPVIYDIGGLDLGKKMDVNPIDLVRTNEGKTPIACRFKPLMIKDCLENTDANELVLYLDADAFLLQRVDELDINDYDIAVTVREEAKHYREHELMGALNAGVIVFRKTKATMNFINKWIDVTNTKYSDQSGLNACLYDYIDLDKLDQVIEKDGLKVKLLKAMVYNNYYSDTTDAKIRHFKGNIKQI